MVRDLSRYYERPFGKTNERNLFGETCPPGARPTESHSCAKAALLLRTSQQVTHPRRELITNVQFHLFLSGRFVAIALRGPPKAPSACPRETTSSIRDTSWPARHLMTLAKRTRTMPSNRTLSQGIKNFPTRFYASAACWLIEPEVWRCNLKRTRPRPGMRNPHAQIQQFRRARKLCRL